MEDEDFDIDSIPDEQDVTEMLTREQFLEYNGLDHDIKRDLMWAYQALGTNDLTPETAKEAGCPSAGAWFIYATTKDNDLSKKAFITGPLTKLLPSKRQQEKDDRAEDGRKQFDLIEKLLRERAIDAPVLSALEKRAIKDSKGQLALSKAGS